jgi:hypothetical protein
VKYMKDIQTKLDKEAEKSAGRRTMYAADGGS